MSAKEQFQVYYAALRRMHRRQTYAWKISLHYLFDKETQGIEGYVAWKTRVIFDLNFTRR